MTSPRSPLPDRVAELAALARLEPSAEAVEQLAADLDAILAFVTQLDALDLSAVEPTPHPFAPATVWRDDEVEPGLSAAQALANAPEQTADGCFAVPEVIES